MYIPYEKIYSIIEKFIPSKIIKDFFYNQKIRQNVNFIQKNKLNVISKLQEKFANGEKINVVFYLYDETKWKCRSLYDLLSKESGFNVKILVTRNSVLNTENPSYQSPDEVKKTYNKMLNKGLNTELAYDLTTNKHLPFRKFNPDIIIYQHPWYVETSQGPVVCSEFALTYYIPYYFPTTSTPLDYYLRFHQYIEKYCVFDELTKNLYEQKMSNKAKNVIVTGQPFLDYYRNHNNIDSKYIIYAPHWTICNQGISYGTFEWNGKFLLEYAKKHQEQKWVFKPHPLLKKALIDRKVMTESEADEYYNSWAEIGLKYEDGDYLDLFLQSKMLITDCSSFLGEYFFTGKPVLHLISKNAKPYNETINQIIKYYYKAYNLETLEELLNKLPEDDYLYQDRIKKIDDLGYKKISSSEIILNDILSNLIKN